MPISLDILASRFVCEDTRPQAGEGRSARCRRCWRRCADQAAIESARGGRGRPHNRQPGTPRPGSHHPQKESTKCNAEAKHGATATHAAPPSVLCTGSAPPPAHAAVSQASRPPAVQRYLHSWPCLPCHVVADQDKAVPLYRSITGLAAVRIGSSWTGGLFRPPSLMVTSCDPASSRSSANCQDLVDTAAPSGKARVTAAVRLETFSRV